MAAKIAAKDLTVEHGRVVGCRSVPPDRVNGAVLVVFWFIGPALLFWVGSAAESVEVASVIGGCFVASLVVQVVYAAVTRPRLAQLIAEYQTQFGSLPDGPTASATGRGNGYFDKGSARALRRVCFSGG